MKLPGSAVEVPPGTSNGPLLLLLEGPGTSCTPFVLAPEHTVFPPAFFFEIQAFFRGFLRLGTRYFQNFKNS